MVLMKTTPLHNLETSHPPASIHSEVVLTLENSPMQFLQNYVDAYLNVNY